MGQYFSKLDENNFITQTIVLGDDLPTSDGPLVDNPLHVDGEEWCKNKFGGNWKQTFYPERDASDQDVVDETGKIPDAPYRKRYGSVGMQYRPDEDVFIYPQPVHLFPSLILDENYEWIPPIPSPTTTVFDDEGLTRNLRTEWDEANQSWWANDSQTEPQQYDWNSDTLTWSKRV